MASILLVPVHLDALVVALGAVGVTVAGPSADFSRLPYADTVGAHNASTPYLGAALDPPPPSTPTGSPWTPASIFTGPCPKP